MKGLFVIGRIASGKTTFCKTKFDSDKIIEIGDVVRSITKTQKRTFDKSLDDNIYEEVKNIVEKRDTSSPFPYMVISSIRTVELAKKLEGLFDETIYVYLNTPLNVCKERFENDKREKDKGISFEDALKKDDAIGLEDLIEYAKSTKRIIIY